MGPDGIGLSCPGSGVIAADELVLEDSCSISMDTAVITSPLLRL